MAAKKTKKTIATTSGEEGSGKAAKGSLTNTVAAKFSDEEIVQIDERLDTEFGRIPRGGFVRAAVLKLLGDAAAE